MTTKEVPYHRLEFQDNCLFITKSKSILNRKVFTWIILLLSFSVLMWSLLKNSPNAFKKPINTSDAIFLSGAGLFIFVNLYLSLKRLSRVLRNYTLQKQNTLFINGEAIGGLESNEKTAVVIQDVGAMGGVGGSFTVGIAQGKKFFGLCYVLQERHAKEVAAFIAENLGYEVESREAVFFPLFKLH